MYSSTLRRTAGGTFGDERMRLMTLAEGPTLLSRLSTTQAVARHTPRTAACFAVVSYPAATNVSRISASFAACLSFAAIAASSFIHSSALHSTIACGRHCKLRNRRSVPDNCSECLKRACWLPDCWREREVLQPNV